MRSPVRAAILSSFFSAALLGGAEPAQQASGKFEGKNWSFEAMGAYAFPSKTGMDDAPGIRVAISNAEFGSESLDAYYDRRHAIETYFQDEETLVVYFDFGNDGKFRGMTYYFGSGDGCGYCYDGSVRSAVKVSGGRIRGTVKSPVAEGDIRWDLQFDVPVATADFGEALPPGGGEPGKVYAAYHEAVASGNADALKPFLTEKSLAAWAEKRDAIAGAYQRDHPDKTAKVVKGWSRGDRATLLVEGETSYMRATSEVLMVKEKGTWRIQDELLQAKLGE